MRNVAKDVTKDLEKCKRGYCDVKQGHHLINAFVRTDDRMGGEAGNEPIISTASPDTA